MKMQGDLRLLCERVPPNLKEDIARMQTKLDGLHNDFSTLRTQWYALISTIVLAGVGALMNFIMKGGLQQ